MNYDVIIIGNTAVGRYAALTAALWEARVALVTQGISRSIETDWLYNFTLTKLTQIAQQWDYIQPLSSQPLDTYQQWAQEVIDVSEENNALVNLATQGVDVIDGEGEFCRLPKQAFIVNEEKLKARAYLIATETISIIPNVPNLSEVGYLTISDLKEKSTLSNLPQNLTIVGDTPSAISLAQTLVRFNKTVTLSTTHSQLLPLEDRKISHLLQAQVEADGINLLTNSPLFEIQQSETSKRLKLGNQTIDTEELILIPDTEPYCQGLNLEGVGIRYTAQGLILNQKLQTTNRKIYGCGGVAGGYPFFNLAQYEAKIALKNALFLPQYTANYQWLPWVISTNPEVARVGMTEAQAKRRYGDQVIVLSESFQTNLVNIVQGNNTGLLKVIVHRNGKILGGHGFGNNAGEFVNLLGLAIAQNIKIRQLGSMSFASPTVANLISQIIQQWDKYYPQLHPCLRDLRKRYFILCRNWLLN